MITRENFDYMLKLEEAFKNRVDEVLKEKCMIEYGGSYRGDEIEKVIYEGATVEVVTTYYKYSDDNEYYEFPLSYLFDDTWKDELKEEVRKKNELKEKEEAEKQKVKQEQLEQKERLEYERLKAKFETNRGTNQ